MAEKNVAIVLAAGRGTRMHSAVAKQFLFIKGKPVLYYSLQTFEQCPFIHEIVLVTAQQDVAYCKKEIVERFGLRKVRQIVEGGKERYHSVYQGLLAAEGCDFVYIHDGARPFVSLDILKRAQRDVSLHRACVVGMPVKDTIKLADADGFCEQTPDRARLWQVQTPQVFAYGLIREAYEKMLEALAKQPELHVTDDAMAVEMMTDVRVKLTEGSYDNLKITTPDDLRLAENLLGEGKQ